MSFAERKDKIRKDISSGSEKNRKNVSILAFLHGYEGDVLFIGTERGYTEHTKKVILLHRGLS